MRSPAPSRNQIKTRHEGGMGTEISAARLKQSCCLFIPSVCAPPTPQQQTENLLEDFRIIKKLVFYHLPLVWGAWAK